jgi:hypothetical protein
MIAIAHPHLRPEQIYFGRVGVGAGLMATGGVSQGYVVL